MSSLKSSIHVDFIFRILPAMLLCCSVSVMLNFMHSVQALSPGDSFPSQRQDLGNNNAVIGFKKRVLNKDVEHYLGIPFAEAPVNELRFKAPRRKSRFGTLVTNQLPPSCWNWPSNPPDSMRQSKAEAIWLNNTVQSEDCLYLNIWTPDVMYNNSRRGGKVVMVWIFGGGFFSGSASLEIYNGAYMASLKDVVVVSMQYRLGALGFLQMDSNESPGNQGLLDQLMALQWIHENIKYFGGDNNLITLFGESAGACSVSLHLLSPFSQRYFRRAILQSGSALAWWAVDDSDVAQTKGRQFAELAGCYGNRLHPSRTVECLRRLEASRLMDLTQDMNDWMNANRRKRMAKRYYKSSTLNIEKNIEKYFDLAFRPSIDNYFLSAMPEEILGKNREKHVDLLAGVTKNEAIYWLVYGMKEFQLGSAQGYDYPAVFNRPISRADQINLIQQGSKTISLDPAAIVRDYTLDGENMSPAILQAILFEYGMPSGIFDDKSWRAQDVVEALDNMCGDYTFKCPTIDFVDYYASKSASYDSKMWMYSFEHHTENLPLPFAKWMGAMHGYEMEYVFGMPMNAKFRQESYPFTRSEEQLSHQIMTYWTNFAATGNPNGNELPLWPRYDIDTKDYLILQTSSNASNLTMGQKLRARECKFWRSHIKNLQKTLTKNDKSCARKVLKNRATSNYNVNIMARD